MSVETEPFSSSTVVVLFGDDDNDDHCGDDNDDHCGNDDNDGHCAVSTPTLIIHLLHN